MKYCRTLFLTCVLGIFLSLKCHAQPLVSQSADTTKLVEYAVLPALSFNSDLGLLGGGLLDRYNYSTGVEPYTSYTSLTLITSTEGLFLGSLTYDKPDFFKKDWRLTTEFSVGRFLDDNFFGIDNNSELQDAPDNNPDLYAFRSFTVASEIKLRFPLFYTRDQRPVQGLIKNEFTYETPFDNGINRLITQQQPLGTDGGYSNLISVGIIAERRDDEIRPSSGSFLKATYGIALEPIASEFSFRQSLVEYRKFFKILDAPNTTFANRFMFRHTNGDVPYWALSSLGGQEKLRGYSSRRFLNDNYYLYTAEIRSWLGKFPVLNKDFGGTLFVDVGESFTNSEFNELGDDIKVTFGIGGMMSFFTDDFFIRGDIGFSEEEIGVYVGTGFLF